MRDKDMAPLRLSADQWFGAGHGVAVQEHLLTFPIDLHWHEFFELSFISEGTGVHAINGVSGVLRPGDLLALTPVDFHELRPDPGGSLRVINLIYTDEMLPRELLALMPAGTTMHVPELAPDFQRILADGCRPDSVSTVAVRATLTRILADVVRAAGPARSDPGEEHRGDVGQALRWLDHHFRDPVRLADVAAVACLSPHHFSGLFRAATGMSFQEYLVLRRLQFARSLLAASDLPVTQVCHVAGFNDLTHFSRSYRRRFGHAPSQHRGARSAADRPL